MGRGEGRKGEIEDDIDEGRERSQNWKMTNAYVKPVKD